MIKRYIIILLLIFGSCNKRISKDQNSFSIQLKSVNFYDNYEMLTKMPFGIYFEINLKNNLLNTQYLDLLDSKTRQGFYISKFYLKTNNHNYKLASLQYIDKAKKCIEGNKFITLHLLLIDDEVKTNLISIKKHFDEIASKAEIVLDYKNTKYIVNVTKENINYYYNDKKIDSDDVYKYSRKIKKIDFNNEEVKKLIKKIEKELGHSIDSVGTTHQSKPQ